MSSAARGTEGKRGTEREKRGRKRDKRGRGREGKAGSSVVSTSIRWCLLHLRQIDKLEAATKAASGQSTLPHTHTHKEKCIKICRANENSKQQQEQGEQQIRLRLLSVCGCVRCCWRYQKLWATKKRKEAKKENKYKHTHTQIYLYLYSFYIGKKSSESWKRIQVICQGLRGRSGS